MGAVSYDESTDMVTIEGELMVPVPVYNYAKYIKDVSSCVSLAESLLTLTCFPSPSTELREPMSRRRRRRVFRHLGRQQVPRHGPRPDLEAMALPGLYRVGILLGASRPALYRASR